jgi:hypothetical protein
MNTLCDRSEPAVAAINQPHPSLTGTWTIDPADSSVSFTWRNLRLWTMTARLHCLGVVRLDAPPPVGVVQFHQPSGLPVLTMALDPASMDTGDADLDARMRSHDVFNVLRHRWWTLRSESLEVLPSALGGSWPPPPPTAPQAWSSCAWTSTPSGRSGLAGAARTRAAGSTCLGYRHAGRHLQPADPAQPGRPRQTSREPIPAPRGTGKHLHHQHPWLTYCWPSIAPAHVTTRKEGLSVPMQPIRSHAMAWSADHRPN